MPPRAPARLFTSEGLTPESCTLTSTSPGPGTGSGNWPTVSTSRAGPFRSYHAAFMGMPLLDPKVQSISVLRPACFGSKRRIAIRWRHGRGARFGHHPSRRAFGPPQDEVFFNASRPPRVLILETFAREGL